MQAFIAHISAEGAFGTALRGDTLFGQLCWMIRYRHGEDRLTALLQGYAEGRPFAVLSDAFPHGLAPRPHLPPATDGHLAQRKEDRKKTHLPLDTLALPLDQAVKQAVPAPEDARWVDAIQPHNSIRRLTGTTGQGSDPFQMQRRWTKGRLVLDLHIRLDTARLSANDLAELLADMGEWGFGRDASLGLGRFRVDAMEPAPAWGAADADAWLTLAPSAPQGGAWDLQRSVWKSFTRFGRHGGSAAHGNPFKSPVLLADTGAILVPAAGVAAPAIVGRGLGGDGSLSHAIPATVHQGYAPAIAVRLGAAI